MDLLLLGSSAKILLRLPSYLKLEGSGHFVIDEKQVKTEEHYDGIWVLRTNTDYNAETVAQAYKALWTVEDIFPTTQSILETRPI